MKGPIIIAANHTSELDVTIIPLCLSFFSPLFPIYFVANPAEKYKTFGWRSWIYGGLFFNLLGGYSVFSGNHDYAISLETHEKILRDGGTVCIFPEGKRTRDGLLNPARGGLGFLIYSTGATSIPIAIENLFHISFWEFIFCRRKITVRVGPPLKASEILGNSPPENPSVEDFRGWSQKVFDVVSEMIK